MDAGKRDEIEARLKRMIELNGKNKAGNENNEPPHVVCNVIRRRKGEQDKRIFVLK